MTEPKKQAICLACGADFEYDWTKLAQHIIEHKDKAHRKSRVFAHKILFRVKYLNSKRDLKPRIPLTAEQKEVKRDLIRELSGETERVRTYCPQCKQGGVAILEVEHSQNLESWRVKDRVVVLCNGCRG